ncbi:hypothetical protein [Stutzerimonas azotifigens]|uniref:hypothetical protein n=1 Tax=Stutzerimonas azotifigens TaxID=291995 RepID=UPI00191BEBFB|nr:hypothetical protein [Stutzerimonas azotifigens]
MNARWMKSAGVGLLALALSAQSLAGPGPGPGPGHRGPDHGPRHDYGRWGPGPGGPGRHGLPSYARELWIGSMLYFVAAGTYYLWNSNQQRYEVVSPPPAVQGNAVVSYEVIAYPAQGQSVEQQGRDRYECHSWAVGQSGFDPATATRPVGAEMTDRYRRALSACLTGRGYSVN